MSRLLRVTLALAMPALALSAEAGDLSVGFESRIEYDSNVFRQEKGEQDDFVVRAGPTVRLHSEHGKARYNLRYAPVYEAFLGLDGIDGWDHFVQLDASWTASEATQFFVTDFFTRTRNLSRIADVAGVAPEPELGRERVLRNAGRVGVRHAFTPRWRGELSFGSRLLEFARETRFDSFSYDAEGQLTYDISKRDQVGFGLGLVQQEFDDVKNPGGGTLQEGDSTRHYQAFGVWSRSLSPTWTLSLRAGPSFATSRESSDNDFTIFGSGEMVKRWENVTASLSYQRSASTVPGSGQATDVDVVSGRVVWKPSPKWRTSLAGSWTREESSIDQELCFLAFLNQFVSGTCAPSLLVFGAQDVGTRNFGLRLWRLDARVERRVTKHLRAFGVAGFLRQDRDQDLLTGRGGNTHYNDFRVIFGIRYELDALHL